MARKKRRNQTNPLHQAMGLLLVDAYNVIHADSVLKTAFDEKPELARNQLRSMCRYFRSKNQRGNRGQLQVCLVFDGDSTVGHITEKSREKVLSERDGVREVFTATGVKADNWILEKVRSREAAEGSWVVSSDLEVIQETRVAGAYALSPAEFVKQSRPAAPRPNVRKTGSKTKRTGSNGTGPKRDKLLNQKQREEIISEFEEMFGDDLDQPMGLFVVLSVGHTDPGLTFFDHDVGMNVTIVCFV